MTPIYFQGYERVIGAPRDWDAEKHGPCQGLPIECANDTVFSVWRLTWRERFALLFGAKIRLAVVSGRTQPPVWLDTIRCHEVMI